jgi:hypothetical protein
MANGSESNQPADLRKELLFKELDFVQGEIARFDDNGLKIKEWCLGIWAGLIAYGVPKREWLIVMAAAVTTVGFGLVELTYRRFQLRFIRGSGKIEKRLNTKLLCGYQYRVHRTAMANLGWRAETFLVCTRTPQFIVFYSVLMIFALFCTGFIFFGKPETPAAEKSQVTISGTVTNINPKETAAPKLP